MTKFFSSSFFLPVYGPRTVEAQKIAKKDASIGSHLYRTNLFNREFIV